MVADPLRRENTGNNTPAIIHLQMAAGDQLELTVAPKGFGSENMTALKMCTPSATREDIISFLVETVERLYQAGVRLIGTRGKPPFTTFALGESQP